ncbi:MAG: SAM-dependent methyltransferase [Polyangiales bacterium]
MGEGIPSGTSFMVSFARGLGVDDRDLDPLASQWLPRWMGLLAEAPGHLGPAARWYRRWARVTSMGMVDHMVLRTEAIDAKLREAIEAGVDQIVILGAGLDARAWRLPNLKGTTVFEVDHPATQRFKRARIGDALPPTEVRYVPVDFERERFSGALEASGLVQTRATAWIWEGVAMYLPVAAVEDSIAQMTRLSAPGSQLLMTYRVPDALPFGRIGAIAIPLVFAIGGEPLGAAFSPRDLELQLRPEWRVSYDADATGWRTLTGSPADPSRSFLSERLAVATREA